MKTSIIIPARLESERIKSKPLVTVHNIPAIRLASQIALKSKNATEVIVVSDSQLILDSLKDLKVTKVLSSEKFLNGTERALSWAIKHKSNYQAFLVMDCGELTVLPETLDKLIEMVVSRDCDVSTGVEKITSMEVVSFNNVKAVISSTNDVIYLSRAPIPFSRNPISIYKQFFFKNIGVTCYGVTSAKQFLTSKSELELIEDIDLLRLIDKGFKIKAHWIEYKTFALNEYKDISKIESEISERRVLEGKPRFPPK